MSHKSPLAARNLGAPSPNKLAGDRIISGKRTAVGGVLQALVGRFALTVVTAFTGVLSARYLHPDGRGELAAMILWPIVLTSGLTFGLPSATVFQLKHNPPSASEIMGAGLLLATAAGVLATVLGWILIPVWLAHYSAETISYARLFLLNSVPCAWALTARACLESKGEFRLASLLILAPSLATLVWLVTLAATKRLDPASAGVAYVLPSVPASLYLVYWVERNVGIRIRHFLSKAHLLLSYGIRAYGIDLCGTLSLYVDQALVVRMLTPASMGIYNVALSLSRVLSVFHLAVNVVLFPRTVAQEPEKIIEVTGRAVRVSTTLATTCGLVVALFGRQALSAIYGSQYADASPLLTILTVEVILSGMALVLSQAYMALGRPGVVTIIQTTGLLLTIPMMLVLVPRWGLMGAALSLLFSTSARLLLVVAGFPMVLKQECPNMLPGPKELTFITTVIGDYTRAFRTPAPVKAMD